MGKHPKNLLFLVLCLLFLFACAAGSEITINGEQDGEIIVVEKGEQFSLSLDSNPTTGYCWELVDFKEGILRQAGEPEYQTESELAGAGGKEVFTFEAQKPGSLDLVLIYHRLWEENVEPESTFQVTIRVE